MDSNPIKTAIVVCNKLIREQVYAIIVSKPENGELSPASVSYTAGFYHIPVIGISSRDSAFSDKVSPRQVGEDINTVNTGEQYSKHYFQPCCWL